MPNAKSSPTLEFDCKKCNQTLKVSTKIAGRKGKCNKCGHSIQVPQVATGPAYPSPTMTLGVKCRLCDTQMYGRPDQAGEYLICPDCNTTTELVLSLTSEKAPNLAPDEEDEYEIWEADEQPLPSELKAAEPEYLAIACEACQTHHQFTAAQIGSQVSCYACEAPILVTRPKHKTTPKKIAELTTEDTQYEINPPPSDTLSKQKELPRLNDEKQLARIQKNLDEKIAAQKKAADRKWEKHGRAVIDSKGRPLMTKYPLVSKTLSFMFYPTTLIHWFSFAIALTIPIASITLILSLGKNVAVENYLAIALALGLAVVTGILSLLWGAYVSVTLIAVLEDSSNGLDEIQNWPQLIFLEALGPLFFLAVPVTLSATPGGVLSYLLKTNFDISMLYALASAVLMLPLFTLSASENQFSWGVYSPRIYQSLGRWFFTWIFFYLESAMLAAIACGAIALISFHFAFVLAAAPLVTGCCFLYFRLLGRLAWQINES